MDEVSTRQLRNDVSRVLRRVRAGERLIVTSDGVPVAQIGPLQPDRPERSVERLIEAGLVIAPRTRSRPRPASPILFSGPRSSEEILDEHRAHRR